MVDTEIVKHKYVVVGGGIAGVTCAESIATIRFLERVLLISETNAIKTVSNLTPVGRYVFKLDVDEHVIENCKSFPFPGNIDLIIDELEHIDGVQKRITTRQKRCIEYEYLCICTGGKPQLIDSNNPRILGIRDTDSVFKLQERLQTAKNVMIVGNGGIASELAHELSGIEIDWVIKDNYIASTFIDPGAGEFFRKSWSSKLDEKEMQSPIIKRLRYEDILPATVIATQEINGAQGSALGPDWHSRFDLTGTCDDHGSKQMPKIHYQAQIQDIKETGERLRVKLSNDECVECDFIVSATGVTPRHDFKCEPSLDLAADGGIKVNEFMETNVPFVYAAGDVCTANWKLAKDWFQMRLWTQARQMGFMAAKRIISLVRNDYCAQDFCFEMFGHVTQLFGYQVVLLGCFNGQGLNNEYEILLRSTPGYEYIKLVIKDGFLRGAILIGNIELAETFENLILNGIDITPYGDDLLNPDIDIDDYFD